MRTKLPRDQEQGDDAAGTGARAGWGPVGVLSPAPTPRRGPLPGPILAPRTLGAPAGCLL